MINLFIEPFVFSCPLRGDGDTQLESFIDQIAFLNYLRDINWASLFISTDTYEVLFDANRYPSWEHIDEMINTFELQIQTKDIFDVVTDLLLNLPAIEEHLGIKEMSFQDIKCLPDLHLMGRSSNCITSYHRLLLIMWLLCKITKSDTKKQILITTGLSDDKLMTQISGNILTLSFADIQLNVGLPCNVNGTFFACKNQEGLNLSLDSIAIWSDAISMNAYRQAVEIHTLQMSLSLYSSLKNDRYEWQFGNEFFNYAQKHGFLKNAKKIKKLLRACAETILKENQKATHIIRDSNNGAKKRLGSFFAVSWRRDIDYEYHLHYWVYSNNVEFAAIVTHNDMTFPNT